MQAVVYHSITYVQPEVYIPTPPLSLSLFGSLQEADENGSDGLDIDEFRTAFGQILGKGKNDQQVRSILLGRLITAGQVNMHCSSSMATDGDHVHED